MARDNSDFSFSGKVGDLIFVQKNKERYVRSASAKPVNQTEASRKSSSDFGMASRIGAKIRKAFKPLLSYSRDETLMNRLNAQLIAVLNTVGPSFAGSKKLIQGDVQLLYGFQFNSAKRLDLLLLQPPAFSMVSPGKMCMELPGNTSALFKPLAGATAVVLETMLYNMDADGENDEIIPVQPLVIPLYDEFHGAKLHIPLAMAGNRVLLAAMGIHYLKDTFTIDSKKKMAAAIVFAEKLKDGVPILFSAAETPASPAKVQPEGLAWYLG